MLFHQNTAVVGGLQRENVQVIVKVWWLFITAVFVPILISGVYYYITV